MVITVILNFSCQEEEIELTKEFNTLSKVIFEISPLSKVKNNQKILQTLGDIYSKSPIITDAQNKSEQRSAAEFENTFTIDTTTVKYFESSYSTSYTFALSKNGDSDPYVINNLLLAKHHNMDNYLPLLVTYNLTQTELNNLNNGLSSLNFSAPPVLERLEGFELSQFGINLRCNEFTTTYTYTIPCECHTDAEHDAAPCGHPLGEVSFTVTEIGACSDDGGVSNGSSDETSGNDGGGSPIDWGGAEDSPYNPEEEDDILAEGPMTQPNIPSRSLVRNVMGDLLDFYDTNLLNDFPHIETAFNIYLHNNNNTDGFQFVDWCIDYLQYMFLSGQPLITGEDSLYPENLAYFNNIVNSNQSSEEIIADLKFHQLAQEAIADDGEVDFEENIIYDSSIVNKPCHKIVIEQAIGSCSPLNQGILDIFETNEGTNLIFKSSNTLTVNANTSSTSEYNPLTNTCDITITFRESYLNTATDLAIARTAIHESLHATLVYMFEEGFLQLPDGSPINGFEDFVEAYINHLNGLPTNLNVAHHELMADFVDSIASSLSSYGSNNGHTNSFAFYKKLSWSGDILKTPTYMSLYPEYINPLDATNNPSNVNPLHLDIVNTSWAEETNTTYNYNHPNGTTYTHAPKGTIPNSTEPCN